MEDTLLKSACPCRRRSKTKQYNAQKKTDVLYRQSVCLVHPLGVKQLMYSS